MSRHFELLGEFRASHLGASPTSLVKMDERIPVFEMCMKAADIGHAGKQLDLHEKWTVLVCEEFFQQGDLEKRLGLPVSMYCDRDTTDIAKSQAGFIQNIVLPLYETLNGFLGSRDIETACIEQLQMNLRSWNQKIQNKRRFTIKAKPAETTGLISEFERLAEKVRNRKRG